MSLTPKEKEFCRFYSVCGNHREAAARAGIAFPDRAGLKLLQRQEIADEISVQKESAGRIADASDGLRRIAFGSVADAVRLIFLNGEECPDTDSLDLFMVSEIKRSGNGGIEIKFFDRLKALDMLMSSAPGCGEGSAPFIDAIMKGAAAIKESTRSDNDEF